MEVNHTSYVLSVEENFDQKAFQKWINENWTLSFWYSAVYVVFIFGGRRYMKDRPRFEIRYPLIAWSAFLAIFSIVGAIRTIPELLHLIYSEGFEASVCTPGYFYGQTALWAFLFTISKVYELGDTVFIVLRKQQLIFLHWYHHITVLIYVFLSYTDNTAPGRWYMVMNYTVHSVMYSYYAFRALRLYIPKWVNMCITAMQIIQMVMGLVVSATVYNVKTRGDFCQNTYENLGYCSAMYLSYLCLFSYFFFQTYITPKTKTVREEIKKELKDTGKIIAQLAKKTQ